MELSPHLPGQLPVFVSTVSMGMMRHGLRRTHDQAAMLHSLGADEAVSKLLNLSRLAAKYHYLQAVFVIEMRMQRGNDNCVRPVLQIGKLFRQ